MAEHELVHHFSCVLFPFRYAAEQLNTEAFNAPFTRKNGKQAQLWQPDKLQSYHLKENVAAMLGVGEEKGTAGQIWRLNDTLRRELNLPEARDAVNFTYRGCAQSAVLHLEQVRLALFTTGVGFLELTVACDGSAETVQDVNYFLTEVKSEGNRLSFEKRLGKDERVTVEFTLLDVLGKLTESLGAVEDFDTHSGLRYIDNKPLMFSYLLLKKFDGELGKLLFGLRTNFKSSYQVPAEQYDLSLAQGVCHPFDNVYWGASLNAAVCCACMTDNEKTNMFFQNTFPSNLRQTYLLLFLLRQHQRYAIQNFQRQFTTVDQGLDGDAEAVRGAYKKVRDLLDSSVSFKLKCMFRDPSSVEHINDVDHFLAQTLRVCEELTDFEDGVCQLESLASGIRTRIEDREARRSKMTSLRKEWLVCLIAALWGCVTFFEGAWDVLEKITGWEIRFGSWLVLIPTVITLLPLYKLVDEMRSRRKEMKELEKEFGKKK